MKHDWFAPIDEEFEDAELGDSRLEARLLTLVSALGEAPTASLASASKSVAAREAAYRFVENRRVNMGALLEPHIRRTVDRCRSEGGVLVVSDTSEFTFTGERRGSSLGRVQGKQRGFLGHTAIAISAKGDRRPLGVLGIDVLVRADEKKPKCNGYQSKKDPERESLRWGAMVEQTEARLDGVAAIHVMDREGDIFELLSEMITGKRRFVIRAGQDRWVQGEGRLFEAIAGGQILLEREVKLSRRLKQKGTRSGVNVWESDPPDGRPPVQWVLLTSEPVDNAEQVACRRCLSQSMAH